MKAHVQVLMALVALGWVAAAAADDKHLDEVITGAGRHLADGRWRKAQDELQKASDDLTATQDEHLRSEYLFYSALMHQQHSADPNVSDAERQSARAHATKAYEAYLAKNPDSGGALNNLAQLYSQDPASRAKALALYDRAVALKDERVSVYSINRAKLLAEMGNAPEALQASRAAVRLDRNNQAAQSLTLALLQKGGDAAALADYLRELHASGLVQHALETGMSELDTRKARREPILIAMAESLADPAFADPPENFLKSDLAARLKQHATDGDIGKGIVELLDLYTKPVSPLGLVWWRTDFMDYDEFRPKSRAAALLALARALGDRCRHAGPERYPCAEAYYQFAIDFTGASADPSAFLSLAEIYVNTGRTAELATIAKQYEQRLFRGKMTAYDRKNQPKIYQFHLALGMLYGYLNKWTDPGFAPGGAIWQLNHALDTAAQYNASAHGEQPIQVPLQAIALLSDGYLKQGAADQSARVRVEAAEQYAAKGDKEGARELLDPNWRRSLPPTVATPLLQRIDRTAIEVGGGT